MDALTCGHDAHPHIPLPLVAGVGGSVGCEKEDPS